MDPVQLDTSLDGSRKYPGSAFCPSGIEPHGNTVLQPAHFTVQTVDAGVGEVLVYIEDPEGHTEEVCRAFGDQRDWHGLATRDHRLIAGMAWRWLPEPAAILGAGGGIPVGVARCCDF